MPSSPLKTDWKNVHVTLPAQQVALFEQMAELLGVSKNAIYQLALRMGGPLVHAHAENMRVRLKSELRGIMEQFPRTPVEMEEIHGATGKVRLPAKSAPHERRKIKRKPGQPGKRTH